LVTKAALLSAEVFQSVALWNAPFVVGYAVSKVSPTM